MVEFTSIEPVAYKLRANLANDTLQELASSLQNDGMLQPLIVRLKKIGKCQLVVGQRRYQAANLAQLTNVPVSMINVDDRRVLELVLTENIHRQDLTPLEEAKVFLELCQESHQLFETKNGKTVHYSSIEQKVAAAVSKSESYVRERLELLNLSSKVQEAVNAKVINISKGRV